MFYNTDHDGHSKCVGFASVFKKLFAKPSCENDVSAPPQNDSTATIQQALSKDDARSPGTESALEGWWW